MNKGTKLYSVLRNKCPRCHEGKFFEVSNPYNLTKFSRMPENCPVCGQKYEPETGFYYGAMYVSYGIGVAVFVTVWVATMVLFPEMSAFGIIACVLTALFLMWPISFRTARLVWINLFIKYNEKTKENKLEQKQI